MAKIKISPPSGGPAEGPFNAANLVNSDRSGVSHSQLLDGINAILATGKRPTPVDYSIAQKIGPHAQQLLMDAYMWRTANPNIGKSPEDKITAYFGRSVDPNNPVDMYRGQLRNINNSPVASYWGSPNTVLQNIQGVKTTGMDALKDAATAAPGYTKIMSAK